MFERKTSAEEFVTDIAYEQQEWHLPGSREFVEHLFTKRKIATGVAVFILFFTIIVARVGYIQVVKGHAYQLLAERNRTRVTAIPSERGLIFDRNNTPLVRNEPNFSIVLNPTALPAGMNERLSVIGSIAAVLGDDPNDILQKIESFSRYRFDAITIKENVDYETALKILAHSSDTPGLSIREQTRRAYLLTSEQGNVFSLSHVLGYESKVRPQDLEAKYALGYVPTDFIGRTGIEASFEPFMRGTYGKRIAEVDVTGREQSLLSEEPAIPGRHVVLTIDERYQKKLEELMRVYLAKNNKHRAAGIIVDPNDGSIRALVSLPTYDSNDFSGGISANEYKQLSEDQNRPLFNRAVSGVYPSGSVIKPIIAAAALEEKVITEFTSFVSNGGIKVSGNFFPDWKAGGHGVTDVRKALAESVNTFFYIVGGGKDSFVGLGVERIDRYLKMFGLGAPLGIELPGESAGHVPDPAWKKATKNESWFIGDTYNLSIGQGDLLVTPLQVAMYTAAVANGGTLYVPRIVEAVIDPASSEEQVIEKRILTEGTIKPYNMNIVQGGMRQCVESGSCRSLQSLPITSAGKTGTAQWSSNHDNHAWFTVFAPYKKPEIVITILVEEGGEGSSVALPIAKDFLAWWSLYK